MINKIYTVVYNWAFDEGLNYYSKPHARYNPYGILISAVLLHTHDHLYNGG